ncbi:hypothetical protein EKQ61_01380 [Staphylococcus gallinarum]|uniref:Uncharacterized protein n=1 Tax=Staphylococcus gallinarum TaxID=1293 RepID=A0A0D0SMT1_STAGA|nr:hypothetical protein [Staphylococcus gallinarum]KIR10399.1 hypothetical protein SH09_13135 [Staphylococcus gallinarum]RTX82926.1 hypothetical protein EKQ61_01380 [Staphylococcus gallinarum]GEQ07030.1 hypothetical protein SGA02_28580 [Staphylococcus gallinarum]SUM34011.1 Uncharacterised protein [Staphylococcus gallinarum]
METNTSDLMKDLEDYDLKLIKNLVNLIVKEDITHIELLKDVSKRKNHNIDNIENILKVFYNRGIIEVPLEKPSEFDFLFNIKKIDELKENGLL